MVGRTHWLGALVVALLVVGCEEDPIGGYSCTPDTYYKAAQCAIDMGCDSTVGNACVDYVDGGATEWEGTRTERIASCIREWCADAPSSPVDASEQ